MLFVDLPPTLEKQFWNVVRESYRGDVQVAITAFLKFHEKYGWKEQLFKDVQSIREEVQRKGGIKEKTVENAVKRYRKSIGASGA